MLPLMLYCVVTLIGYGRCQSAGFPQLIDDYRKWRLEDTPEYGRRLGVHEFDERVTQLTIQVLDDRKMKAEGFLGRLREIKRNELAKIDRLKYDVLKYSLETVIEGHKWKFYGPMNPINFLNILWAGDDGVRPGNLQTYEDFLAYTTRLFGYAEQPLNFMIRMRKAIEYNTTNHWVSMDRAITNIDALVGDSIMGCPMYAPFNETLQLANMTTANKQQIRSLAVATIAEFRRNYQVLKEFILTEYKNASRSEYGVSSFKDGAEYYRACLKWHLRVDISPEEVHQIGLAEVDRIHNQMQQVMYTLGFKGSVSDFFTSLLNISSFILSSKEEVIQRYTDILRNRIWKKLPKYFKNIPDNQVMVRSKPYDGTGGSYKPGPPDGSRPGVFYVNTHRLTNNPTFSMVALALHEGDPGHHFQDIITAMSPIPDYQKSPDRKQRFSVPLVFPSFSSYTEGWAMYAESLGEKDELDLYEDEFELMGRYSQEIFRACRLVIDTGLHYYNWSRERAINYLLKYTSKSRASATIDVDRYITWPGQACSYKIGELKIKELRKLAERRLGTSFDIREFHAVILETGPAPLSVLEASVNDWLAEQDSFDKLLGDFFQWRLQHFPEFSSMISYKYNDRLQKYTIDELETQFTDATIFMERLQAVDKTAITSHSKLLSYDVLMNMLHMFIDGYRWREYGALNPIHFMSGLQADPTSLWSGLPMDTQGDFVNYIRRLELVPNQMEEMMNLTRRSIELGTTSHAVSINRIPGNIDSIISINDTQRSPFFEPFREHAARLFTDVEERGSIEARLTHAVINVLDAFKTLKAFIVQEYMPNTRPGLGINSLPNGEDLYRAALKFNTDLDISPEEIHERGKKEVARIAGQMRQVMTKLGYPTEWTIRQVYNNLTTNETFLLKDGDETLKHFNEIIFQRIAPLIQNYFKEPPDLPLEVRGSPTDGTAGQYFDGTADGSRPGVFLANVHRPEDNPTFTMVSLSLHEAIPGHHLASSYALKSDMPDFRKYTEWKVYSVPYFFPFYNAYIEGWALYCEYLGEEMGIYHNDYELLGRYSDEMKRAARLVIDTGIHHYNWSRQEAIDYMLNFTALSEQAAANQIDRYVTWPGQATGYKIGEMKIKELRLKAERKLGSYFDIRDFHSTILRGGPLPLDILDRLINEWITSVIQENSDQSKEPNCVHVTASGHREYVNIEAVIMLLLLAIFA